MRSWILLSFEHNSLLICLVVWDVRMCGGIAERKSGGAAAPVPGKYADNLRYERG